MKRCPECQFLYENESTCCDMDGTPLRYTVALPSIPGLAKSIWDRWTIALLCAVVIGTVLVILYRATPRAYTSSTPRQLNSINQEIPPTNQQVVPSETAAQTSVTEENVDADSSDGTRDPFESPSTAAATKVERAKRGSPLADEKEVAPAPVIHFEAASSLPASATIKTGAKPATETIVPEKSATQPASQNAAAATSRSSHPTPPAAAYSNKPATQDQKKESGVKSFFKKAGKVLKKPFGDN